MTKCTLYNNEAFLIRQQNIFCYTYYTKTDNERQKMFFYTVFSSFQLITELGRSKMNIYKGKACGKIIYPPKSRCWRTSKENFEKLIKENRVWFDEDGGSRIITIRALFFSKLMDFSFLAIQNLCKMFFWPFVTENAII